MLQLLDNYAATYTTLTIGILECVALCHVYGELCVIYYKEGNSEVLFFFTDNYLYH